MMRILSILFMGGLIFSIARADDVLPGTGFPSSRYTELWTKSPFAVATPEGATGPSSPDYSLVGIARFDGVSYASLIDKQSREHFLLASDQPSRGLTLVSVSPGKDSSQTSAAIEKGGETLTLKLDAAPPAPVLVNAVQTNMPVPVPMVPGTPMTGILNQQRPPVVMFHRPIRYVPMPPGAQQLTPSSGGTPLNPSSNVRGQ